MSLVLVAVRRIGCRKFELKKFMLMVFQKRKWLHQLIKVLRVRANAEGFHLILVIRLWKKVIVIVNNYRAKLDDSAVFYVWFNEILDQILNRGLSSKKLIFFLFNTQNDMDILGKKIHLITKNSSRHISSYLIILMIDGAYLNS